MAQPSVNIIEKKLLWDDNEVGVMLGVPPATVHNLHRTRQLPGLLCGKHLRWHRDDVVAFVESLRNGNGSTV